MTLTVTGAVLLGRPASPDGRRTDAGRTPGGAYPPALRAASAQVTAEGLHVTLDGGRARLPHAGQAA